MGKDQTEQSQESPKSKSFFERYKEKAIKREERKIETYKGASGSWIFYNRIMDNGIEILGWILLIIALYLGIQSGKWAGITCDRITPEFCNQCFIRPAQAIISGGI